MLPLNVSISTILTILMTLPINRTVMVNDFLTSHKDFPLVVAFVSHSSIAGYSMAHLIWKARPMEDLSISPLQNLFPKARKFDMASLQCMETWMQQEFPTTNQAVLPQPQGNAWASQPQLPTSHQSNVRSPADTATRGGRSAGRENGRGGRTGGGNHRTHTTMPILHSHPPVLLNARRQVKETTRQASTTPAPVTLATVDIRSLIRSEPMLLELVSVFQEVLMPMSQSQVQAQMERTLGPVTASQIAQESKQDGMYLILQELLIHARRPPDAQPPASSESGSSARGNV